MSKTRETIADVRAQRSELTQKVQSLETDKAFMRERLDNAGTTISSLHQELEAMTKRAKDAEGMKEYYAHRASDAERELAEVHAFVDALPEAPARERDVEHDGKKTHLDLSAATRIAQWLILKKDK